MQLLERNERKTPEDIDVGDGFLDNTPKAQATKTKQDLGLNSEASKQQRKYSLECRDTRQIGRNYLQATYLTKDQYPVYNRN